jgi:Nitrile hydratase beta subunit
MTDPHAHKLPSDIGGTDAGPIDTVDHGMRFWERQANALRSTLTRKGFVKTDELRRAAEELGERYSRLQYFEITTFALRTVMVEKGYITEAELEAKMNEVRARFNVPDEMESPLKKGKAQST